MDTEWPDVVIDEDDAILDEEILLSGEDLAQAEREAYAALQRVANSAEAAIGNLVRAIQGFSDALRVIHDEAILSANQIDAEYVSGE